MWYYLDSAHQQQGPVEEGRLSALLAAGTISPQTLVWRDGLTDWIPYQQLPPGAPMASGVPVAVLANATCQICQQPVGVDNLIELAGIRVCAACKPKAIQTLSEGGQLGSSAVWRDGKKVVARDGARFPARCVKCNGPAAEPPLKRKLYWHNPLIYLLVFLHFLIYIIVAVIVRKRASVELYLCPEHLKRRKYFILATWLAVVIGLGVGIWGIAIHSLPLGAAGFLLLIIGAPVIGILGAQPARTVRIKNKTVWMAGAGKDFVASLPEWND
jgi:hypothetical protein